MTITGSGNVFSEVPGNARDSGYITVNYTVPANINNKTYKDPFYRVPSFPGNVKLITKAAYFMNGNTASTVNTDCDFGWEDVWTCDGTEYVNGIGSGSERRATSKATRLPMLCP